MQKSASDENIIQVTDWLATPYTIYMVLKDATIPLSEKLRAIAGLILILLYLISPFDLVPEAIPFAGWLYDLAMVPLGLTVVRKFTPGVDIGEKKTRAEASTRKVLSHVIFYVLIAMAVVLVWLGAVIFIIVKLVSGN